MRRKAWLGLAVALVLLPTSAAFAQGGGQGGGQGRGGQRGGMMGGRMGGGLMMLRMPAVQTELKMTQEQIGKIDAKQQELRAAQGQGGGGFGGGQASPEERQKMMAQMQEANTKAVASILDATQLKRFHQLELQQAGPAAIANRKDVQTELKVTEDQLKKIAEVQTQAQQDQRAAMQSFGNFQDMTQEDRTKMMAKMQEMQKATGEKIAAVLTDAQKAQWKEMLGTPFTFPAQPGFGGFGGGGGRRQPNNQ